MLREEWLSIGYEKGLIDDISVSEMVSFCDVYKAWFMTKINRIKPQSVDRIEVTYNKYYRDSELSSMPVHAIDESRIVNFLNDILIGYGNITQKEYARIYQIVNNVMQYGYDMQRGHCYCVNWNSVKRYIALENIKVSDVMGHADIRTTEENYIISYGDTLEVVRKALESGTMLRLKKGGV